MVTRVLVASALLAVVSFGCSSSTTSAAPSSANLAPFSKYCTGTTSKDIAYLTPAGPGSWSGSGATLPAGTTFLVSVDFSRYGGFAILDGGTPAQLKADFSKGLVLGEDFTSSCAPATPPSASEDELVLLRTATLYANQDLSGSPCSLPAATSFQSYGYSSSGGGTGTFQSDELQSKCGFTKGYTNDMTYARLFAK